MVYDEKSLQEILNLCLHRHLYDIKFLVLLALFTLHTQRGEISKIR